MTKEKYFKMNNTVIIKGRSIEYNNQQICLDDLMTIDFYEYMETIAPEYDSGHIFDNVVYLNFVLNIYAYIYFFRKNNINRVIIEKTEGSIKDYVYDAARLLNIRIEKRYSKRYHSWISRLILCAVFIYMFFQQISVKWEKRDLDRNKDIVVLRTPAAKKKIKASEEREILCEDSVAKGSLYSFSSRRKRICYLMKSIGYAFDNLKEAEKYCDKHGLYRSKREIIRFLQLRLLPVSFYRQNLEGILSVKWNKDFITGNNLDMYAMVEEECARKYGIRMVCIPHGLEYGFRFPHCFTGDYFYSTSAKAEKYFNEKYNTNKFHFVPEIAGDMFALSISQNQKKVRKIVYFTEPREPYVNIEILRPLVKELGEHGYRLYIKHHPKDNMADYEEFNGEIEEIQELSEAIIGNICIARKSTVLLEGLYNNALCAAIVINEKDNALFKMFPSLMDDKIQQFHSIEELTKWICEVNEQKCE